MSIRVFLFILVFVPGIFVVPGKEAIAPRLVDGKPYQQWVDEILTWRHDPKGHPEYLSAIRQFSQEDLVYLAQQFEPPKFKSKKGDEEADVRMSKAGFALWIIGKEGSDFIPLAIPLLSRKPSKWRLKLVNAVNSMNVQDFPLLNLALKYTEAPDSATRRDGVILLGSQSESFAAKVTLLKVVECCEDNAVRERAVWEIGKFDSDDVRTALKRVTEGKGTGPGPRSSHEAVAAQGWLKDRIGTLNNLDPDQAGLAKPRFGR